MNAVTEQIPDPLLFTDAAAAKVKSLIDEEGNIIQRWVGTVPDEELRNSLDQATSS